MASGEDYLDERESDAAFVERWAPNFFGLDNDADYERFVGLARRGASYPSFIASREAVAPLCLEIEVHSDGSTSMRSRCAEGAAFDETLDRFRVAAEAGMEIFDRLHIEGMTREWFDGPNPSVDGYLHVLRRRLARLDLSTVASGWLPIESASKDGGDVLVWCADTQEQFVVFWRGDCWCYAHDEYGSEIGCTPTHWRPLPPPPGTTAPLSTNVEPVVTDAQLNAAMDAFYAGKVWREDFRWRECALRDMKAAIVAALRAGSGGK